MKNRDLIEALLRHDMDSHVCIEAIHSVSIAGEDAPERFQQYIRVDGCERINDNKTSCILLTPSVETRHSLSLNL